MSDAARALVQPERLPRLIEQAAAALAKATTPAEILEARERANVAYTAAKMAARLAKAKEAHDEIVAACRKAMADALVIEAQAQCRLADEYDAAQEQGEVARRGGSGSNQYGNIPNEDISTSVEDIGLTSKLVHEARIIRDAEKNSPGIVRKTVDERLGAGQEPTRADVKRATRQPKPRDQRPSIFDDWDTPERQAESSARMDALSALEMLVPLREGESGAEHWGRITELLWTLLYDFVAFMRLGSARKLKISGDPECIREWQDLKDQVEALLGDGAAGDGGK
jgi:hypothetical protein